MKWPLVTALCFSCSLQLGAITVVDRQMAALNGSLLGNLGKANSQTEVANDLKRAGEAKTEDEKNQWEDKAKQDGAQAKAMDDASTGCKQAADKAKGEDSPALPPPAPSPPSDDKKKNEPTPAPTPVAQATPLALPTTPQTVADTKANEQRDLLVAQVAALKKDINNANSGSRSARAADPVAPAVPAQPNQVVRSVPSPEIPAAEPATPHPQVVTNAERLKARVPNTGARALY